MTSMAPGGRGREAGFTLMELLVAMALLGLLSLALFSGIRLGARSWDTGTRRMEQLNDVEVAQSLLRRQLGTARGLTLFDADDRNGSSFVGAPDSLFFAAPLPAHRGIGGPYGFALRIVRRPGGRDLVLAWRLHRPEQEPSVTGEFEEETVLLSDVADVAFEYYGAPERNREPDWFERWNGADGMPLLVRVEVEFPAGDGRSWPMLTVAPALSEPSLRTRGASTR